MRAILHRGVVTEIVDRREGLVDLGASERRYMGCFWAEIRDRWIIHDEQAAGCDQSDRLVSVLIELGLPPTAATCFGAPGASLVRPAFVAATGGVAAPVMAALGSDACLDGLEQESNETAVATAAVKCRCD